MLRLRKSLLCLTSWCSSSTGLACPLLDILNSIFSSFWSCSFVAGLFVNLFSLNRCSLSTSPSCLSPLSSFSHLLPLVASSSSSRLMISVFFTSGFSYSGPFFLISVRLFNCPLFLHALCVSFTTRVYFRHGPCVCSSWPGVTRDSPAFHNRLNSARHQAHTSAQNKTALTTATIIQSRKQHHLTLPSSPVSTHITCFPALLSRCKFTVRWDWPANTAESVNDEPHAHTRTTTRTHTPAHEKHRHRQKFQFVPNRQTRGTLVQEFVHCPHSKFKTWLHCVDFSCHCPPAAVR